MKFLDNQKFYNDTPVNINNWGISYWYIIHLLACRYKLSQLKQTYYFYKYLACILPCNKCQSPKDGYPYFFKNNDIMPYLKNKESLFLWTFKLHNYVNHKTEKNLHNLTFEKIYNAFNNLEFKYHHIANFFINLFEILDKYKESECRKSINHVILNIIVILKKSIIELEDIIDISNINTLLDAINVQKVKNILLISLHNMFKLNLIEKQYIETTRISPEKCYKGCKGEK